jgi:hypothetical protein
MEKMSQLGSALIIALPGRLRDGLRASGLVTSIEQADSL